MVALKAHLENLVMAELNKYGKATKVLTEAEFEAFKKRGVLEEELIDSCLYNKALLARSRDKELNKKDTLEMIKRDLAHDRPKKTIRLTRDQKEFIKMHFSSAEMWDIVKPPGFKGDKIEFVNWVRENKVEE